MRPSCATFSLVAVIALSTGGAVTAGGIVNGSFETGNLDGWSTFNGGDGSWIVAPEAFELQSGLFSPAPTDGTFQAITDQGGPGAHVLLQQFAVPTGGVLEFDMWWNNQAEVWLNPGNLDFEGNDNQHARVDLLRPGSDPFSTNPADILMNLVTLDSGPFAGGYEHEMFDISAFQGDEVVLRFAEVDNQFFFNFAVDNVFVTPSPAGLPLLVLGAIAARRRRR